MIESIGADCIEIHRFRDWHIYSDAQLLKILTQSEIDYCRAAPAKSSERFAVRFAAREAFFKALCARVGTPLNFFWICKNIQICHTVAGAPTIRLSHALSKQYALNEQMIRLSLSHSQTVALAFVVLQKSNLFEIGEK